VTEMVTGIDLVKAQLRIAAGEKLSSTLCRSRWRFAAMRSSAASMRSIRRSSRRVGGQDYGVQRAGRQWVRVDTAQYAEGVVPPYYDSLIAKLICHGKDREEAMNKMQRALSQFVVQGIHTTIPLHQKIFADEEFRSGQFDTKFMERFVRLRRD
jgi:acetyl-CoA carboxylase biotin carboxylase subunit